MTGAMSRRKGNRAMAAVVTWLRNNGHPYATRRGGGDTGDDILDAFPDVSIEVKDCARMELAAWVDQAVGQAHGRPAVVLHKRRGRTDVGQWYATCTVADLARIMERQSLEATEQTHQRVTWRVYNHRLTTAECTCGRLYKTHVGAEEAEALFAAHVAETLNGGSSWAP